MQSFQSIARFLATALLCLTLSSAAWAVGSESSSGSSAPETPYDKGVALVEQEDYAGAIEQLDAALEQNPQDADVLNYLGYAHRKLGDYEKAEEYYLRALQSEPEHRGANEYLGELYLETDRPELAEERLQVLDDACFFGCEEYDELKAAIEAYRAKSG